MYLLMICEDRRPRSLTAMPLPLPLAHCRTAAGLIPLLPPETFSRLAADGWPVLRAVAALWAEEAPARAPTAMRAGTRVTGASNEADVGRPGLRVVRAALM
jgi:hypothetical protein